MLIELSSACNLNCKWCFRNRNKNEKMSYWTFRTILDSLDRARYKHHLYLTGQGEPLTNPQIWDCLAYAKALGFRTMLSTNGTLINHKNVDLFVSLVDDIQISFDSLRKGEELRTVDPFRILDTIKLIRRRLRRGNTFQVNILVSPDNWDEIPFLLEMFKGINLSLELVQLHHTKNHPRFATEWPMQKWMLEKVPELLEMTKGYSNVVYYEFGGSFKQCFSRWNDFGITADRYIVPCAWRLDPDDFNLGQEEFAGKPFNLTIRRVFHFWERPEEYMDVCEPCIWIDEILESKGVIF